MKTEKSKTSRSRGKAPNPATPVKRDFIARTIKNYGHHILPREMKIINELFETVTDDLLFWGSLNLPFQLNSLAYLKKPEGKQLLKEELDKFSFKPEVHEKRVVGERNFFLEQGLDKNTKKVEHKKCLKEVMGLW